MSHCRKLKTNQQLGVSADFLYGLIVGVVQNTVSVCKQISYSRDRQNSSRHSVLDWENRKTSTLKTTFHVFLLKIKPFIY